MAASKACQIAIATRPTTIAISRILPIGWRGQGPQGAGLVALARRVAEGDLQGEPGEEQVDDAVADETGPGEVFQRLAVRGAGAVALGVLGDDMATSLTERQTIFQTSRAVSRPVLARHLAPETCRR